jgi:hypothetical protein
MREQERLLVEDKMLATKEEQAWHLLVLEQERLIAYEEDVYRLLV